MTFGEMLVKLMDERSMTQAELARRSGLSKQIVNEIIRGRTKEPTFSNAKALADGLDVSLLDFADMLGI